MDAALGEEGGWRINFRSGNEPLSQSIGYSSEIIDKPEPGRSWKWQVQFCDSRSSWNNAVQKWWKNRRRAVANHGNLIYSLRLIRNNGVDFAIRIKIRIAKQKNTHFPIIFRDFAPPPPRKKAAELYPAPPPQPPDISEKQCEMNNSTRAFDF